MASQGAPLEKFIGSDHFLGIITGAVNGILPESTAFNVQRSTFGVRRSAFRARARARASDFASLEKNGA